MNQRQASKVDYERTERRCARMPAAGPKGRVRLGRQKLLCGLFPDRTDDCDRPGPDDHDRTHLGLRQEQRGTLGNREDQPSARKRPLRHVRVERRLAHGGLSGGVQPLRVNHLHQRSASGRGHLGDAQRTGDDQHARSLRQQRRKSEQFVFLPRTGIRQLGHRPLLHQ